MIILLTGKPGVGKSTVVEKFTKLYSNPMQWVLTREIRDSNGERVGFKAINSEGVSKIISHKHDLKSDVVIGQNRVDLAAVDEMFANYSSSTDQLTLIDEIGPIQLLSPRFSASLKQLFKSSDSDLVATIHLTDKRLSRYRSAKNVMLVQVSDENRDSLPASLASVLNKREDIKSLKPRQLKIFRGLVTDYLNSNQPIQLAKLLNNALPYLIENKVERKNMHEFLVKGNHDDHIVRETRTTYICDCDLFNGKGIYAGQAGVCSHIQAISIKY